MQGSIQKLRGKFVRDIVLAVLFVSGLVIGVFALQDWRVRSDVSQSYISQVSSQASAEFARFYEPVENALTIAQKWGMEGVLEPTELEALNVKFIPVVEQIPQISGVIIAGPNGAEYFLLRTAEGWLTRSRPAGEGAVIVTWRQWQNARKLVRQWQEKIDYDPRTRSWYRGVIKSSTREKIFWSEPYVFFTQNLPGVTAAKRWQSTANGQVFVIAFDVLLGKVLDFVSGLKVSKSGRTFLLDDKGAVFLRPEPEQRGLGRDALFRDPQAVGLPILAGAVAAWRTKGEPPSEPLQFETGGRSYWAAFQPLQAADWQLWIGSVAPESDFLEGMPLGGWDLMTAGLGVLLLGGAVAFWIVRKYQNKLKDLSLEEVTAANFDRVVRRLIEQGESRSLEFKSTMRMNLKSGKHGKEIEIAWLKAVAAFMNTDGGNLLLGVNDAGEVVGLEADEFENDDRCRLHFKNLVNQHIGLEFSDLLRFHLGSVDGTQVALVQCERSHNPVFLTANKEEAFYVRSGPSSVELPVSKALKYLEQRE